MYKLDRYSFRVVCHYADDNSGRIEEFFPTVAQDDEGRYVLYKDVERRLRTMNEAIDHERFHRRKAESFSKLVQRQRDEYHEQCALMPEPKAMLDQSTYTGTDEEYANELREINGWNACLKQLLDLRSSASAELPNFPLGYSVFEASPGNWRWESILSPESHAKEGFSSFHEAAADCTRCNPAD